MIFLCCSIILLTWSQWYIPYKNRKFWSRDYRCEPGFSLLFQKCKDIDECGQTIDWCGSLDCVNTVGSHFCQCRRGYEEIEVFNYEYQAVETACRDIDECQTRNTCPGMAECSNTEGTYTCQCKAGYEGDSCSDFDECSNGTATCGEKSHCLNTGGLILFEKTFSNRISR